MNLRFSASQLSLLIPAGLMVGGVVATAEETALTRAESSNPLAAHVHVVRPDEGEEPPATGLTGNWNDARLRLEEQGITPYAVFTTEVFGNVSGGMRRGTTNSGVLDLGLELELEKLVGWKGGSFTVSGFAAYGADFSTKYVGDFNVISNLFSETDFNIFNLFLSQSFGDDLVLMKAGQIAVDDDFMAAETANYFLNGEFGALPTASGNMAAPIYPLAAPGLHVRVNPSEKLSFHVGVYAGDAGPVDSGNHGFEWRTGGAAGWVTFVEADYNYGSGTAKVGGYYHSGEFEDYRTGDIRKGLGALYGIVDHRFIEPVGGHPGLAVFARGSVTTCEERATVRQYFDAGFALNQVFTENDVLGLAVGYTDFGDDFLATNPGFTTSETVLELTYQIAVNDWWTLQPDVQYIIHRDSGWNDALVPGLRTNVVF